MRLLAKPYTECVGRSTTPLRAPSALLVATFTAPFLVLTLALAPAFLHSGASAFSDSQMIGRFVWAIVAGAAMITPFLWILGGLIWIFAHGLRRNGPLAAIIAALTVSTIGVLFSNGSPILQGPSGSFFSANGVDIIVDGTFNLAGWLQIGESILLVGLAVMMTGLLIWVIAYKGSPVRPSRDMQDR